MAVARQSRLVDRAGSALGRIRADRSRLTRRARRAFSPHRTIVVPLLDDGWSDHALELACRLAADRRGHLLLVAPLLVEPELPLSALFAEEELELKERLRRAEAVADTYGVSSSARLPRTRNAAKDVVEEAREIGATLIVVAAPVLSRNGFAHPFPVTVERILRDAPCRVMVATGPFAGRPRRTA